MFITFQMTSVQLLIAGIRLITNGFNEYSDIEEIITNNLSGLQSEITPKLMCVQRSYDSCEIGNHGLYLAWKVFDFSKHNNPLSVASIQELDETIQLAKQMKAVISEKLINLLQMLNVDRNQLEFGLYNDYYDMDRNYYFYK